jgi:hypothetical protein
MPALTGLLKNLTDSFGIKLPNPTSTGTIDPAALDTIFSETAKKYPMQFTAKIQARIADLVASAFTPTAPTPVLLTNVPLPAGKKNETIRVPIAFAEATADGAYNVMIDGGDQILSTSISGKTKNGFIVSFTPEAGGAVKASTFGITVIG